MVVLMELIGCGVGYADFMVIVCGSALLNDCLMVMVVGG